MKGTGKLIPRRRLYLLPAHLRLKHEYCFFLHDEVVRLLKEYEKAKAHFVGIKFKSPAEAKRFQAAASNTDTISAMRACGYEAKAKNVIMNQITMALVSDSLHHIYEALRCAEKKKIVVTFNLLRKPLTDSILYLSWILADEEAFYKEFSQNSPNGITSKIVKNNQKEIISSALGMTKLNGLLTAEHIERTLFDRANIYGLQKYFQHAVHLVTTQHLELLTTSENFNFIFKNLSDVDSYDALYKSLPDVMLFYAHVCFELFSRITKPEEGARAAFDMRSTLGLLLLDDPKSVARSIGNFAETIELKCGTCDLDLKATEYNTALMLFCESVRCTGCGKISHFPFSWLFQASSNGNT